MEPRLGRCCPSVCQSAGRRRSNRSRSGHINIRSRTPFSRTENAVETRRMRRAQRRSLDLFASGPFTRQVNPLDVRFSRVLLRVLCALRVSTAELSETHARHKRVERLSFLWFDVGSIRGGHKGILANNVIRTRKRAFSRTGSCGGANGLAPSRAISESPAQAVFHVEIARGKDSLGSWQRAELLPSPFFRPS